MKQATQDLVERLNQALLEGAPGSRKEDLLELHSIDLGDVEFLFNRACFFVEAELAEGDFETAIDTDDHEWFLIAQSSDVEKLRTIQRAALLLAHALDESGTLVDDWVRGSASSLAEELRALENNIEWDYPHEAQHPASTVAANRRRLLAGDAVCVWRGVGGGKWGCGSYRNVRTDGDPESDPVEGKGGRWEGPLVNLLVELLVEVGLSRLRAEKMRNQLCKLLREEWYVQEGMDNSSSRQSA